MTADMPLDVAAPVRRLLGDSVDGLGEVRREPLDYDAFLAGRALARVRGTAEVSGHEVAWSFIEKVTEGPAVATAYLYDNSVREFAAYRSGMLTDLAPGTVTPRLLAAHEGADGKLTLWIEDMAATGRPVMSPDDVVLAANRLGRLAGRWLARLPTHTWLFRGWIQRHSQPHAIADGLATVEGALRDGPIQAQLGGRLDEATTLIRDQGAYGLALEALTPTLCHHDAVAANVFVRGREGAEETVLIDWESVGPGPAGADLASLLFASPRRGDFSVRWLRDLVPAALDAYALGLREMGATVDPDDLLLGVHASIALRWTLVRDVIRLLDGTDAARRGSAPHETSDEAMAELVALVPVLLDSAAEGRRLMARR